MRDARNLEDLERRIPDCALCPRLRKWCERVAVEKRAAWRNFEYWGKPVPSFGDHEARLLIVGLAPGAHGGNRTGRIFTGDRSGDWLFRALYETGFASQPASSHRGDGLTLNDAYVTAVVRCAPPANKPAPQERDRCLPYLKEEFRLLSRCRVIVALGGYAWDGILRALKDLGSAPLFNTRFGHGAEMEVGPYLLLGSYHPSQQNTFTGRLTAPMLRSVFERARNRLGSSSRAKSKSASPLSRTSLGSS
ncbi:MAG: uracil-DNA glycosylase [Pseudomonadota bacterium]